jgi:ketosteroid isomerase-like protein
VRFSPILGLSLLVAACAPKADAPAATDTPAAAAPLSAADLEAVKAVDAAFAAAMNAKDTTAVWAIYAPDAYLMPPDSPAQQGAAAHPALAGFLAFGATDFALTPTTVYGIGDLAYTVGTATFKMGGATETVKYAEVLRKGADGKWRYVVDMFSGVAPPPAKK